MIKVYKMFEAEEAPDADEKLEEWEYTKEAERTTKSPSEKTTREEILENRPETKESPLSGGSNEALYIELENDGAAVFKPKDGEASLKKATEAGIERGTYYKRERAAYLVDKFLDFNLVPETTIREINGRVGSMQRYIPKGEYIYNFPEGIEEDSFKTEQMKLWILDLVLNNGDRHSGNFLIKHGKIYAIDNGMSFGKRVQTYIDFWDESIPEEIKEKIDSFLSNEALLSTLNEKLSELLSPEEIKSLFYRIKKIGQHIKEKGLIPKNAEKEIVAIN